MFFFAVTLGTVHLQSPWPRVDSTIDLIAWTEPRANARPESVFVLFIKGESLPLIGWRGPGHCSTQLQGRPWVAEQRPQSLLRPKESPQIFFQLKRSCCWEAFIWTTSRGHWRQTRRIENLIYWCRKIPTKCCALLALICGHYYCWSWLWSERPAAAWRTPLLHTDSLELCVVSPTRQLLCVSEIIWELFFFSLPSNDSLNSFIWKVLHWGDSFIWSRFVRAPAARCLDLPNTWNVWLFEEVENWGTIWSRYERERDFHSLFCRFLFCFAEISQ